MFILLSAAFAVSGSAGPLSSTFLPGLRTVRSLAHGRHTKTNALFRVARIRASTGHSEKDTSPFAITRRNVLQLANAGLGFLTLGLLVRMRNQFRLLGPRAILAALGIQGVPSRAYAAAPQDDAAAKREAAINFLRQRDSAHPAHCPPFPKNADWINSRPLALSKELKGKVVLLDFFTYCCINCQHVLPKLAALEEKYGPDGSGGFVVVGVHSAKFSAERETANIAAAVERYNVRHPVVNDEHMEMWNTIGINSWPSFLLVGPSGNMLALWSGERQETDIDEIVGAALALYKKDIDHRPLPTPPPRSSLLRKPTDSPLRYPGKLAAASDGKSLFIADSGNNRLLRIDAASGACLAAYGSGHPGLLDSDDPVKARFRSPQGVKVFKDRLYVADTENHAVRMIDITSGAVTTVGGNGEQGFDYAGGKHGKEQSLSSPWDVEITDDGVMYVAMAGTHQVWSLDVSKSDRGLCSVWEVFSGTGRELEKNSSNSRTACWAQPSHLSIGERGRDSSRFMFVADSESSTIRYVRLDPSTGSHPTGTLAGGDGLLAENLFAFGDKDGVGSNAKLQHPLAVQDANDGKRIFVADSYNHRIKTIDESGQVTSFVGNGKPGFADGTSAGAQFWEPGGLALSPDAKLLYVSDTNNCAVRVVDIASHAVATLRVGLVPPAIAEDATVRLVQNRRRAVFLPKRISGMEKIITFRIFLPPRCHFTEGTTSRWQSNEVVGDEAVRVRAKGIITEDKDNWCGAFTLPLASVPESGDIEVETVVYYCSDEDEVCRSEADIFQLRRLTNDLTSTIEHTISIRGKARAPNVA